MIRDLCNITVGILFYFFMSKFLSFMQLNTDQMVVYITILLTILFCLTAQFLRNNLEYLIKIKLNAIKYLYKFLLRKA